ncbi:AraC family transcriptional regulator [Thalassospira sp. TSL5-1]|uniref:helix-turn-helix domain-containing protein n=1 Tax=Thalassospira sp. TSL5-1 TaxID=1544451 RepID=UPI00093F578C|nr:helix-turn-helix transcriptional regulator [Thalassospira sp. TSL5-1]OKH89661.1 AraC family transcriptional regulator [Thalassospira sp. TSL5-1]
MADYLIDPSLLDDTKDAAAIRGVVRRSALVRDTARHAHAYGQLIGPLKGSVRIETDAGIWVVPACHAVWVPPHHHHGLHSNGPFQGWSIYVPPVLCASLPQSPVTLHGNALLEAAIKRAALWQDGPQTPAQHRLAQVILDEIASALPVGLNLPAPQDPRLQRIARKLAADLADQRGMAQWANWAGMAPRTLSRRFVAETGLTFRDWRQRARLLAALEMLASDQAVTTIALDLGYENISAFIAAFKKVFGVTPGQYVAQLPDAGTTLKQA